MQHYIETYESMIWYSHRLVSLKFTETVDVSLGDCAANRCLNYIRIDWSFFLVLEFENEAAWKLIMLSDDIFSTFIRDSNLLFKASNWKILADFGLKVYNGVISRLEYSVIFDKKFGQPWKHRYGDKKLLSKVLHRYWFRVTQPPDCLW